MTRRFVVKGQFDFIPDTVALNDGTYGYEVWSIQLERTVTVEDTA